MGNSFSIGRIFGIRINIDWSWLLIFLLITWNLSALFGQIHNEWSLPLRWSTALVASLFFFLSVLAHELAHSLVARAQGVPVRNITLFLFGGVSNIQREPPSPRAEFFITIVGPITSVLMGIFFSAVGGLLATPSTEITFTDPSTLAAELSPWTTTLLWLGSINILLGVFNMIPGFPLDGGRILRSFLWAVTDDLRRSTHWASWIGQTIGWLFIIGGIAMVFGVQLPFFGTGLGGLWLAFIGWFLRMAAAQSYRQVVINDILEDVPVTKLMRSDPPTVSGSTPIANLIHDTLMNTDEHAFPVIDGGQLTGLVSLEDVRKVPREEWETTLVRDIMTPADALLTLSSTEYADEAMRKLQQKDVRQLPVLDNGRLEGLLRRRDIVRWLQIQNQL